VHAAGVGPQLARDHHMQLSADSDNRDACLWGRAL
jgi:hypothetical protein